MYVYIYIYNLRTKILDSRGFDSSRILILRGGILMSTGNIPEMLSQHIFSGVIFVGKWGVRWLEKAAAIPRTCPALVA